MAAAFFVRRHHVRVCVGVTAALVLGALAACGGKQTNNAEVRSLQATIAALQQAVRVTSSPTPAPTATPPAGPVAVAVPASAGGALYAAPGGAPTPGPANPADLAGLAGSWVAVPDGFTLFGALLEQISFGGDGRYAATTADGALGGTYTLVDDTHLRLTDEQGGSETVRYGLRYDNIVLALFNESTPTTRNSQRAFRRP